LLAGMLRLTVAAGGGWLALTLTGSVGALFMALGLALLAYGAVITIAIACGAWDRRPPAH
jgi:hypothetical protein